MQNIVIIYINKGDQQNIKVYIKISWFRYFSLITIKAMHIRNFHSNELGSKYVIGKNNFQQSHHKVCIEMTPVRINL